MFEEIYCVYYLNESLFSLFLSIIINLWIGIMAQWGNIPWRWVIFRLKLYIEIYISQKKACKHYQKLSSYEIISQPTEWNESTSKHSCFYSRTITANDNMNIKLRNIKKGLISLHLHTFPVLIDSPTTSNKLSDFVSNIYT